MTPAAIAGSRVVGGAAPATPAVIKGITAADPPSPSQAPPDTAGPVEPPELSGPPPEPEGPAKRKRERPAEFASKFAPKRKKGSEETAAAKEEEEPQAEEEEPKIKLGMSFEEWNKVKKGQAEPGEAADASLANA